MEPQKWSKMAIASFVFLILGLILFFIGIISKKLETLIILFPISGLLFILSLITSIIFLKLIEKHNLRGRALTRISYPISFILSILFLVLIGLLIRAVANEWF